MSTTAETAVRSVGGLFVVAALLITIWVARDTSARTGIAAPASGVQQPGTLNTNLRRSQQE